MDLPIMPIKPLFDKPFRAPQVIPRVELNIVNSTSTRFSTVVIYQRGGRMEVVDIEPSHKATFEIDFFPDEAKFHPDIVCQIPGGLAWAEFLVRTSLTSTDASQDSIFDAIASIFITNP
jgi:hypothetical protein